MTVPRWQFDELRAVGVDYGDPPVARDYDANHQRFRDYAKSAQDVIQRLELDKRHAVIDMGAGTGAFAIHAAARCGIVYAVDVSTAMLDVCRQKAEDAGLDNVESHHGGFLTYRHAGQPVDAMVSIAVLHHLPDFWKLIALRRAAGMIKPQGRLYLFDVVFSFDPAEHADFFEGVVRSTTQKMGADFATEVEIHLREEFSTCDWIMEALLEKAGFAVDAAEYADGFTATYVCTRTAE